MSVFFLVGPLVAAALSAVFLPLFVAFARQHGVLIDTPGERSSHRSPTVRGGGIVVLLAVIGGLASAHAAGLALGGGAVAVLSAALSLSVVGLADDLVKLPVWPRLLAQIVCAAGVILAIGPVNRIPLPSPADVPLGVVAVPFTLCWLVAVTNFFNFMDGIDGLAAGQAGAICLGVLAAQWSESGSLIAGVVLGSLLGFLPYNWWPSRVFLGDVGSLPLGFLLASLPLLAEKERRPGALLAMAIGLALFVLDPFETLARRWRRGEAIGQSHRDHRYQQLLAPEDPHGPTSAGLVAVGLLLSLVGAAAYRWPRWGWPSVAVAGAAFLAERRLAKRRSARRPESNYIG